MSFLVTGLPRMRSAWFAALLSVDETVYHDAITNNPPLGAPLSDPCAACVYPDLALEIYGKTPIVIVERDSEDAKASFCKWSPLEIVGWDGLHSNYIRFRNAATKAMRVSFYDLGNDDVVAAVAEHCGIKLPRGRIAMFQTLNIGQRLKEIA